MADNNLPIPHDPGPHNIGPHNIGPQKPYRPRHDGWTAERQRLFIESLTRTGCVRDACRVARISSTSAYRIRRRIPEFAESWALALRRARTPLEEVAWKRAVDGRETVIIRGGKEVERRITPSDSILALLIRQGKLTQQDADRLITWEEWQAGVVFDERGNKISRAEEKEAVGTMLDRKLGDMRMKLLARRARAEDALAEREARVAALEAKYSGREGSGIAGGMREDE